MKMNKIKILVLTYLSIVLIAGCSNKDETAEGKDEVDKIFEETDKVAIEFYKAGFELNIPKIYEMLSSKGKESIGEYVIGMEGNELDVSADELIQVEEFENYKQQHPDKFKAFNKLDDEYEIRRYGDAFNKETKEVVYRVEPWNEYKTYENSGDYNYISLIQNEDGKWVVKEFLETIIPDQIKDKNSGTIIHAYESNN
ncbi:hypothetical protein CIL03_08435 [Virgibacillus indicus]|uniref:DUF3993 domain-containing protein n=1 Tax=Virgibacillus indicus TaxID=2024554 RepID=A0A265NB71_9BACI|nr:hypothetical protein [Virgibacillus indicus]OZU89035.1 hypothetical protein CIL03_08435 [Virgibacillus indicus]